jgi:hypothetical protein
MIPDEICLPNFCTLSCAHEACSREWRGTVGVLSIRVCPMGEQLLNDFCAVEHRGDQ